MGIEFPRWGSYQYDYTIADLQVEVVDQGSAP
jgi:hypothetical protein